MFVNLWFRFGRAFPFLPKHCKPNELPFHKSQLLWFLFLPVSRFPVTPKLFRMAIRNLQTAQQKSLLLFPELYSNTNLYVLKSRLDLGRNRLLSSNLLNQLRYLDKRFWCLEYLSIHFLQKMNDTVHHFRRRQSVHAESYSLAIFHLISNSCGLLL